MSIIYKTTNLLNKKYYIGQHFTSADDGYLGSGLYIKRAIKKHGKENFVRESIDFCNSVDVDKKEVYWIDTLSARNPEIGYNIAVGGNSLSGPEISYYKKQYYKTEKGKIHKQESSKRMKLLNQNNNWSGSNNPNYQNAINNLGNKNPFYGKNHSIKTKIQIAKSKSQFLYFIQNLKTNKIYKFNNSFQLTLFCLSQKICTKITLEQLIWRSNKLPHQFRKSWTLFRKLINP